MNLELIKAFVKSICPESAWKRMRGVDWRMREAYWRLWDVWHHVETGRPADITSLSVVGHNRAHAQRYEPSGSVRTILKDLRIDYEQYGFVDFGSGKGRVLLEASEFPFKSVEGVEFSIELHRIAESNIRSYRRARVRCGKVRSILADATEFQLPVIPLVIYLFNPFTGPVLASVIGNIRRSEEAQPRDLIIICKGKWMKKETLDCMPNIHVLWRRESNTAYRLHR